MLGKNCALQMYVSAEIEVNFRNIKYVLKDSG